MNTDTTSIDHIFKAIGRDFNEELPALTLIFVVYNDDTLEDTLNAKKSEIKNHPAGEELLNTIEHQLKRQRDNSFFIGPAEHTETKAFGLIKKNSYIGACFISTQDLNTFEDQAFTCKLTAYAIAFEGLHNYLNKGTDKTTQLEPMDSKTGILRSKLMRDCFAAMMMESLGNKGAIQMIAKKYAELTTQATPHFKAEDHPMLMALDGVNVVYKDLKSQASTKTGLLSHTGHMAEEIGTTYDASALKQWVRFAQSAQEMAWADYSTNEILSAAIYGTDSPYIRSNAHICAETLNTNPVPLKNTEFYNPFADPEINERLHNRICRSAFLKLLEAVNDSPDSSLFLEHARQQTLELLKGNPMGWCAPALIEAENAYRLFQEQRNPEEAMIDNAFQAAFTHIKWANVQKLSRLLIAARRADRDLTPELAIALLGKDESFASFENAFEILKP